MQISEMQYKIQKKSSIFEIKRFEVVGQSFA